MRPDPQYGVQLSVDDIPLELPIYPIYGVTPSDKYIPIQVNEDGQLSVGNVTISGPVTIDDVVIKGVDPDNGNTTEDIAVYNLGMGNGYSVRSTLFDGENHLKINLDGSINTVIMSASEALPVSIDHSLDSVAIYGTDGLTDRFIKTDSSGNLITATYPLFSNTTDTFITTGIGPVYTSVVPFKRFALQVKGTNATPSMWTVTIEGSIDGVNFTSFLQHTQTLGELIMWSGPNSYVLLSYRVNVSALTLGLATNIKVSVLGTT